MSRGYAQYPTLTLHRHARCTLLTQPKIHLGAGCSGMCMPKRAGTAQASVCPLPPVSSVMEPDAGVARMCTPYLPARAPSCTKRTTRKLKNPSDHGWFEHMAARQAAIAFTKLWTNGVEKHRGRAAEGWSISSITVLPPLAACQFPRPCNS